MAYPRGNGVRKSANTRIRKEQEQVEEDLDAWRRPAEEQAGQEAFRDPRNRMQGRAKPEEAAQAVWRAEPEEPETRPEEYRKEPETRRAAETKKPAERQARSKAEDWAGRLQAAEQAAFEPEQEETPEKPAEQRSGAGKRKEEAPKAEQLKMPVV